MLAKPGAQRNNVKRPTLKTLSPDGINHVFMVRLAAGISSSIVIIKAAFYKINIYSSRPTLAHRPS